MPARDHHSIGEVLSLLQDDFPDITISKIRFLESQGLINPERTPSGYRRFFERDLRRLRWILTQQRDHYLPLKVIREKLAAGEADAAAPAGSAGSDAASAAEEPASTSADARPEPSPASADLPASEVATGPEPAGETAPPTSPQATIVTDEVPLLAEPRDDAPTAELTGSEGAEVAATESGVGATSTAAPSDAAVGGEGLFGPDAQPDEAEPSSTEDTVELLEASEAVGASEPGEPTGVADDAVAAPGGPQDAGPDEAPVAAEATVEPSAGDAGSASSGSARRTGGKTKGRRSTASKAKAPAADEDAAGPSPDAAEAGAVHDAAPEPASPDDDGPTPPDRPGRAPANTGARAPVEPSVVALTRDELAEASGCSVAVLSDLERFGLLQGKTVGRGVLYDSDALVVARLAARFANHGLEPRHLRSFRLAAEREIGLFAQVVGPLLQRRDAMAHERAMETLTDLAELASDLHEVLVQNLVSREFGNR